MFIAKKEEEEPEEPVTPDYPDYYNIYVDECEGVTVEASTNVVREGNSMSFTVEVAEGYTAEDMVVKVKRSLFGYTDVIEPNEEGKSQYLHRNLHHRGRRREGNPDRHRRDNRIQGICQGWQPLCADPEAGGSPDYLYQRSRNKERNADRTATV